MSSNTLLVIPATIKERTALHDNVDEKLIAVEIKTVQDLYIMPLLGRTLLTPIQDQIATGGEPTGNYKTLVDNYLVDCICNYVLSEMPESLNYQFYNKGLSGKTGQESDKPNMSEMYSIVARYKTRAEYYKERARRYLMQYSRALFPEYNTFVAGVDTVYPDRSAYECPIYLGDESTIPKDDYSLQKHLPPYNSNDPFYNP